MFVVLKQSNTDKKTLGHFDLLLPRIIYMAWLLINIFSINVIYQAAYYLPNVHSTVFNVFKYHSMSSAGYSMTTFHKYLSLP